MHNAHQKKRTRRDEQLSLIVLSAITQEQRCKKLLEYEVNWFHFIYVSSTSKHCEHTFIGTIDYFKCKVGKKTTTMNSSFAIDFIWNYELMDVVAGACIGYAHIYEVLYMRKKCLLSLCFNQNNTYIFRSQYESQWKGHLLPARCTDNERLLMILSPQLKNFKWTKIFFMRNIDYTPIEWWMMRKKLFNLLLTHNYGEWDRVRPTYNNKCAWDIFCMSITFDA